MRNLVRAYLANLEAGTSGVALLERIGEPEPAKAHEAIRSAASHEDLRTSIERWLPGVLTSARPGSAAQKLEQLADGYRQTRSRPLEIAAMPGLPRVLGSSDFLARVLLRHPNWVEDLRGALPDPPPETPIEPEWTAIRIAKYRGLLRVAARDLLGRPFEDGLAELSGLADRCLLAAMACTARATGVEPPGLLALGKLGGYELNFSSDVDLLFVYQPGKGVEGELKREVTRFIRYLKTHLEAPSEDGFGYRVDLDLRPEGTRGTLTNSVEAAVQYYEQFGAEWERQMLIRLRPLGAGPAALEFVERVEPFVYRRLIDPSAIRAVRRMKTRIEDERLRAGLDLEADLKEGPGGIRDVEFLVQALQLFYGARDPAFRTGNVLDSLAAFVRSELLPRDAGRRLRETYLWLRRAEHGLQMAEERQVRQFPRDPMGQLALARRMGYDETDGAVARERLVDNWIRVRAEVRAHFARLVLESESTESLAPALEEHLRGTPLLDAFAMRAEPFLARHVTEAARTLPEGATRGLARVIATSPEGGRYLSHRPDLFERIRSATPQTLADGAAKIESDPRGPEADDLETFLDRLRLFRRDETVLVASLDLSDRIGFETASRHLSIVAEACVRWALAMAQDQLDEAEAPALSILGMGKVAGRELTYRSDLDLIFLYPDDNGDAAASSRIARRLIAYLTTMTGAGVAYEIDSRLRPSGRQGALVSTFSAFGQYQVERAALWEHMAMLRTRAIAGPLDAAQDLLKSVRRSAMAGDRAPWPEVASIRERVERERGRERDGEIAFKTGRGGLMDVDFLASGALLERGAFASGDVFPAIPAMLRSCVAGKGLDALLEDYTLLRRLEARTRWIVGRPTETLQLSAEIGMQVAELMEPGLSVERLGDRVEAARRRIRSAFAAVTEARTIQALQG